MGWSRNELAAVEKTAMSRMGQDVCIYNKTREVFLALHARVVDSLLLPRLPELGPGLWITRARVIHTFGVPEPVDLIFLDHDCRVVDLRETLLPFRFLMLSKHVYSVLVMPGHSIYRSRTRIGDQLVIKEYREAGPLPDAPGEVVEENHGQWETVP